MARRPARGTGFEACRSPETCRRAAPVALCAWAGELAGQLPRGVACLWLRARVVWREVPLDLLRSPDRLVTVVSAWPSFLRLARAMCAAAGGDLLACRFQDAGEPGWEARLAGSALVIADALTAQRLPAAVSARQLSILSDETLQELRAYAERFLVPAADEPPAAR